jgi:ankyrin repeat protein
VGIFRKKNIIYDSRGLKKMKQYDKEIFSEETSYEELEKLLLKDNKDPNSNDRGFNALHRSGGLGFPVAIAKKRISLLLECGIDPNSIDHAGIGCNNAPLHAFIANERVNLLMHFIEEAEKFDSKIDFNVADFQSKTPLILAAKMRHEATAIYILIKGGNKINLNHQDKDGMSALHYACTLGQLNLAELLINMGAIINITNNKNRTPLDCIALTSKEETESILKSVSIEPSRDETALRNRFVDHNLQSLFSNTSGDERIIANKANSEDVKEFIKKGLRDDDAIFNKKMQREPKRIEDFVLDQVNKFTGISVLERSMKNRFQMMSYLVEQGADYSWLLRYVSSNANMEYLNYLLIQSNVMKYINIPGLPSGRTALHQAALNGHVDVCDALLDKGARIDIQDADKNTPLHLAVIRKHEQVAMKLAKKGANSTAENRRYSCY